jgi:hypothetical protein
VLPTLIAALLADVLTLSCVSKVLDLQGFGVALRGYRVLRTAPTGVVRTLRILVPAVEAVLAILLYTQQSMVAAALGSGALFAAFSLLIFVDDRSSFANCGCAGKSSVVVGRRYYLVRSTALLVLSLALVLSRSTADTASVMLPMALLLMPFCLILLELPTVLGLRKLQRELLPTKVKAVRELRLLK